MPRISHIASLILILTACQSSSDHSPTPANSAVRLTVSGKQLLDLKGNVMVPKGLNWGWWGTAQPQDASAAAAMHASIIRIPFRWYFGGDGSDIRKTGAPGNLDPQGLAQLDQYIDWCAQQKLWIILFAGSDQGAGDNDENYWTNEALREEFIDTWKFLVQRYRDKSYIAAYEILSEPHPKKPFTNEDVKLFYEELIGAIRSLDQRTPLMIGGNDHYDINLMEEVYTSIDDHIIYTFNYYLPTDYIKPDKREEAGLPIVSYPGTYTDFDGAEVALNKTYLDTILQPALAFRDKHNVPILVNQVGARSRCPEHLQYMKDVAAVFSTHNVPFIYWTYRTRDEATEYGLYWFDKTNNMYVSKPDQIELMKTIFESE